MIRKLLFFIWAGLFFIPLHAQINPAREIAPFEIVLPDGKAFKAADLKKNIPAVLIYFAPDCDHCHAFTKALLADPSVIKNKQVVMITYFSLPALSKFDKQYNVSTHANIKIGTEGNLFIVQKYYNIQRFPFIVLYKRNGREEEHFAGDMPFQTIKTAILHLR